MKAKDLIWPLVCLIILFIIYHSTNASKIFELEPFSFIASIGFYFLSIVLWIMAWTYLVKERFISSFRLNLKALFGVFAPFGLGGDAIRAHLAKTERIAPEKALGASFVIKFYKFILMFLFLIIAIYLLAFRTPDFQQNTLFFISMIFTIMSGAVIVLLLRVPSFARLLYRILNRIFIFRFHEQLNRHFLNIKPKDLLVIVGLLLLSSLFEMLSVAFVFLSIGQDLLLPHVFIFWAVAASLATVTVTPQGIGFVEGGSYLILSLGYFSLTKTVIGSFLIIWSVIRIWIPSVIGLLALKWKR